MALKYVLSKLVEACWDSDFDEIFMAISCSEAVQSCTVYANVRVHVFHLAYSKYRQERTLKFLSLLDINYINCRY